MLSPDVAAGFDPVADVSVSCIFDRMMRHAQVDGEVIEYYAFSNFCDAEGVVPFVSARERATVPIAVPLAVPLDAPLPLAVPSPLDAPLPLPLGTEAPASQPADVERLFQEFQQKIDIFSPFAQDQLDAGEGVGVGVSLLAEVANAAQLATELVVVASFVDRLPNLAGLARSCEIFAVKTLYVPNAAALASPDFANVAMTAERWLDIRELPVEEVAAFLAQFKREHAEGRVVALEQTSNSTPLQDYCFAKRTCLVLGHERTGIPAEVLHLVDDCVEIPQFGRVRSLNVHVSGSIAIWKAREQDLM